MKFKKPEQQLKLIKKGAEEIIPEKELYKKLEKSYKDNKPLKVKIGFDPTAPDIHVGHTVVLRKLKHFQDLGHDVIFLIGDFTSLIGDPSGRDKTRKPISKEQILENTETYKDQVFKILDPKKTIIDFNSRWLGKLNLEDIIKITSKYTVARILERDDFSTRYKKGIPICIHEILYPIFQAYDSVALKADVELGGTDQKFNLLVGRTIQKEFGQEPQVILTMPILEGLDGIEKMSKSLGNYIGIYDPPAEMFGKIMSISDDLMFRYFLLLTDTPKLKIENWKQKIEQEKLNPKDLKIKLGKMIVEDFWSEENAEKASQEFEKVFSKKDTIPEDTPVVDIPKGEYTPKSLLKKVIKNKSGSEIKRLIQGGAVSINNKKISNLSQTINVSSDEIIIKAGKKDFYKIKGK